MSNELEKFDLKLYLDTKFEENKKAHEALQARADKTNGRVIRLEKWRWAIGGALSLLAIVFSVFGTVVFASYNNNHNSYGQISTDR